MALRGPAAQAPASLGGGGGRPLPARHRRPLGPVPAVPQAAAGHRRRGARRLLQAGRGLHLPSPRLGGGAREDRRRRRGAGVGHAFARDPLERRAGPLPLAAPEGAPRRRAHARGQPDRPARDPAGGRPLALLAAGPGYGRGAAGRRADPAVPEPPGLCAPGPLPGLRRTDVRARQPVLAGGAPLHRPAGLPPHRLLHAQARPLPPLRGQGLPGLDRAGRGAGGRGGRPAVSGGAAGGVLLRHRDGRAVGSHPDRGHGGRRDRRAGRHPGRRQRPQLPQADPGGRGRRRPVPEGRGPSRGRAHLSVAGPGLRTGGPGGPARPGHAADLHARAPGDAGLEGAGSRRLCRRRDGGAPGGGTAAVRSARGRDPVGT